VPERRTQSATLLGSEDVLRRELKYPITPIQYDLHKCTIAVVRLRLDEQAFATVWLTAAALSLDEVGTDAVTEV
jgi:hypothetical protein